MHVAIIMDGNGRWALQRGLPRTAGHRAGAKAVDRAVSAAARGGIDVLTLYAFSDANWQRPKREVASLFALFRRYLASQAQRCLEQSIRLNVIGRRDRLDARSIALIERAEALTAHCTRMVLRIAVDYSAQWSLMHASRGACALSALERETFSRQLAAVDHSVAVGDVDLLIRTGGERRMSDFLLWECAYAELHFLPCFWPDFDERAFDESLVEYSKRDRRFGRIQSPAAAAHGANG